MRIITTVPSGANIVESGPVTITGDIAAGASITVTAGSLVVQGNAAIAAKNTKITSHNGNIQLDAAQEGTQILSHNGNVTVNSAHETANLNSRNGNVRIANSHGQGAGNRNNMTNF